MHNDKDELEKIITRQKGEIAALKAENTVLRQKITSLAEDDKEFFALRDLIALMPGNIFWKDKEGKLLGCNNQLAKILSLTSPEEIIGKNAVDLTGHKLAKEIDKIDKKIMASSKATIIEETGFDENHNPAVYLSYKIPLLNKKGDVVGLLGTALNITEQKKLEKELKIAKEKAEASNRAKSQFLAVTNHELRTPLTGIVGLVNLLKQKKLAHEEQEILLKDLESCSQYLLSLVNTILDFSRLEADRYQLNMASIELKPFFKGIFSILSSLAKDKKLLFAIELDPALPFYIQSDVDILRQIIMNLASNAIKYSDNGEVRIKVNVIEQSHNNVRLKIMIVDTGRGIPKNKLKQIFKPFQQLEDTYIRQSSRGGTGLGLAIVKEFTKLLHMKIEVSSKVGEGSTFTLIGDFKLPSTEQLRSLAPDIKAFKIKDKHFRVLLLEDDAIVQRIHKKLLEDCGCHVDVTGTGKEALEKLNNQQMVFVDIGLPDMSGIEVIKQIRKKSNDTTIIALSGYTGDEERSACFKSGANEVMAKPIMIEQIWELLDKYTSK